MIRGPETRETTPFAFWNDKAESDDSRPPTLLESNAVDSDLDGSAMI